MSLREASLKRVVKLMKEPQRGLAIKDRTFHFHMFPDCFVGSEFVSWALHNNTVETRERAVFLGQDLLDRGIIFHASNDQPFKDGYFFYTFQNFPEISDAEMDVIVMRMKAHPTGVSIQDRTHHLRNYHDCFVGREAVDWFMKNVPKYTTTRTMAVKLGQELMNKGIVHSAAQQPFADSPDFYFFQKPIHAGYLGKLNKTGTGWKTRWFCVKDLKEKKMWYYNSPRDPVPRDFIPLTDACVRVVLDQQDMTFLEICTPMRVFALRPTSSALLARWVNCLSEYIGFEGFENNLCMERAERSISSHESRVSSKAMREQKLVLMGPHHAEAMSGSAPGAELAQHAATAVVDGRVVVPKKEKGAARLVPDDCTTLERLERIDALENFEALNLMNDDDLDIDFDDSLESMSLPTGNGVSGDPLDRYEDGGCGFMGEVNYISTPRNLDYDNDNNIDNDNNSNNNNQNMGGGFTSELSEMIAQIKLDLLTTSSQDSGFQASTLSLIPPSSSFLIPDTTSIPTPLSKHENLSDHNFHFI